MTAETSALPVAISLGSNIEPRQHLAAAVAELGGRFVLLRLSAVFESDPAEGAWGPPFLNAAALLETTLDPLRLRRELRRLELKLGRRRPFDPNAPRTLDLDISLYGDLRVASEGLVVPDPGILTHAHIALPLADLAPDWVHPLAGLPLRAIAARLAPGRGVRRLAWRPDAAFHGESG